MYALQQAGNNWFDALCASLIACGFHQSTNDPCLVICNDCILLIYVDNCLLFAKSKNVLDSILDSLEQDFVIMYARRSSRISTTWSHQPNHLCLRPSRPICKSSHPSHHHPPCWFYWTSSWTLLELKIPYRHAQLCSLLHKTSHHFHHASMCSFYY